MRLPARAPGTAIRDDGIDVVEMLAVGFGVVIGTGEAAVTQYRLFGSKVRTQPMAKQLAQFEHVGHTALAAGHHQLVQGLDDFLVLLIDLLMTDFEAIQPFNGFDCVHCAGIQLGSIDCCCTVVFGTAQKNL